MGVVCFAASKTETETPLRSCSETGDSDASLSDTQSVQILIPDPFPELLHIVPMSWVGCIRRTSFSMNADCGDGGDQDDDDGSASGGGPMI